jgi:hypothetical protein
MAIKYLKQNIAFWCHLPPREGLKAKPVHIPVLSRNCDSGKP